MPKNKKIERSANYSYYSDLLWCTVPLIGMSWYVSPARRTGSAWRLSRC